MRSPLNDPRISALWIAAAREIGFSVERTQDAYASTDGGGRLLIGVDPLLDENDSVAQLIFHELCHALVEGRSKWRLPDWGLDNANDRDAVAEQACLRLSAHLADLAGLRAAMKPTTEWADYYNRLGAMPLTDGLADDLAGACALAVAGAARDDAEPARTALQGTLVATAQLLAAPGGDADTASTLHPVGYRFGPPEQSCGTCAWHYQGGRGRPVSRCRQAASSDGDGKRIAPADRACERWEGALDCQTCGACCREAYHVVSVSMRDPVVWKQPDLIVRSGHRFSILRSDDRCAALNVSGTGGPGAHHACRIYEDRPQTCRDFERGGRHCLVARRRVGLSRA